MPAKINSKYTTVLLHVFIWSLLISLPHFFFDSRNTLPGALPSSFYFVTNLYPIGLFYFNAFFLYPSFFNKKRWWAFLLSIAAILFFWILDVERPMVKKNIPEETAGGLSQKGSCNNHKISRFSFGPFDNNTLLIAAMTPQFAAMSLVRVFYCF